MRAFRLATFPFRCALILAILFSVWNVPCSAQTAADIVARNIAARGGLQNFQAIQSMKATGKISFGGDTSGDIRVTAMRPSFFRVDIHQGDLIITQSYDGQNGWQVQASGGNGAPTSITGGALAEVQDQAENAIGGPLLDSVARGNKIELVGEQAIDGKPCYKLKITMRSGHLLYQYLDKSTYLELKEELPRRVNGQEQLIEEAVGDYRRFGGWLFPCSFVSVTGGKVGEKLQIENVELNLPMDRVIFQKPAEPAQAPASSATPAPPGANAPPASAPASPKS